MRYVRKINNSTLVSKVLTFNQKALPDPNAKYTTMEKFMRSYSLKGRLIRFGNATFKFIDHFSHKKAEVSFNPTIYSEKKGYQDLKPSESSQKKDNLVIPLIDD
ncbi:MAG: hypothetical protein ACI4UE_05890 [Candidatus Scatovivens sp.]